MRTSTVPIADRLTLLEAVAESARALLRSDGHAVACPYVIDGRACTCGTWDAYGHRRQELVRHLRRLEHYDETFEGEP